MKAARVAAALAVALTLQTTLAGAVFRGSAALDLVLIVVVYFALSAGPVTGLLAGSAAGLVQDALSSGVLGIGGLANTIVGFLAGVVGTQFIVTAPLPRFVVFVLATVVHAALFMGLYVLLDLRQFPSPYAAVAGQAIGNGFVGVVVFQVMEWLPGLAERRRARRPLKR
ncbi:MAG: rod shape-determining protein MreD [Vicinamibacterales bacterium]